MQNSLSITRSGSVQSPQAIGLEGEYEQIFMCASDAMMLLDVDTLVIVEANQRAETLFGYSRDELIGRSALDLVPEYLHDVMRRNAEAMNNGLKSLRVSDRPRLRKDGTEIRVQISAGVIELAGRKVFQEILRDETVRVQREDTLRDQAAQLSTMNSKLKQEIAESTIVTQKLEQLSLTDSLTGLFNRRAFDERFEIEWRRAIRTSEDVTVIVIDIDHFKSVNDRYGHLFGDELLVTVADKLQSLCKRAGDFIARFGGEEFVILTTNHTIHTARALCEDLRKSVEILNVQHQGDRVPLTVSVGFCSSGATRNRSRFSLLESADDALYEAKRTGRNRVVARQDRIVTRHDAAEEKYEPNRMNALNCSQLLDTPPEARFDRITRLAARLFDVPYAIVSLVDSDRQWFKSAVGLDCEGTARDVSLCTHAIAQDGIMVVPDTLLDQAFSRNPLVTGAPYIRFYAGCPVWTPDNYRLGTLCVIDTKPRNFSDADMDALFDLASIVRHEMTLSPR